MTSRRREWVNKLNYKRKSKPFLLPMLKTRLYHQNKTVDYLISVNFVQLGFPQIVLVFDNVDYVPLKEDIHRLSMHHCYIDVEYGDEDKEVIMFFDIPKEYKKDFELFKKGAYSKFSDEYKKLLVGTYGNVREKGISPKTGLPNINIYDAIYPTDDLRKLIAKQLSTNTGVVDWKLIDEVLDPPIIELEEFKTIEELYGIEQ